MIGCLRTVVATTLLVAACAGVDPGESTPEVTADTTADQARPSAASSPDVAATAPEATRVAALMFDGSDFYGVPDPLPPDEPGVLIYLEPLPEVFSGRVYRVLYHSRSVVDDQDVAVSGTIWVPPVPPPEGGYPIVSFGHGNDGSADICANSRPDDPAQIWYASEMSRFLAEGYVVAYTDYEGLGTPGPFMFAVNESSARSILDAARAARDLLDRAASDRVIVYGHSLGALAALATGERARRYAPELDVRGVVALDGGTPIRKGDASDPSRIFMQAVSGFSAAYPGLRTADVLTAAALRDLHLVEETCDLDSVFERSLGEARSVDPLDVPAWAAAIRATNIEIAPLPTFLVFAALEGQQNVEAARDLAATLCKRSQAVLLEIYRADHIGVLESSWADVDAWMTDRFAGAKPVGNCSA
jgi:pimeloyl-ACP methyl ester carboxylesterase